MTLYIDTTDFNKMVFGVFDGKKTIKRTYKIDPHKSNETLGKLDEFIKGLKIKDLGLKIKQIVVNKGPGSYTGVRVGVTIAQALGFAWNVPVKAVVKDKFIIS